MAAENFESIAADIRAKKFAPVYFFCGEEAYFIDMLCDLIEQHALNDMEKAFNQTIAYGKDLTTRQILETCGRLPMMAERQVVIIKEAQALSMKEEDQEQLTNYLKKPVKSTLLVFAWKYGTPDGRKAFGKEAKKSAVYFESKPLYENQVVPWVHKWLSAKKYKIEDKAAELLVEFTGPDLSKVANELEKLIINKQPGATITEDDIEQGVGVSKEFNVFELNNALGVRNKTKAYQIADYFVANPKNGPIEQIIGTLYLYFGKILVYHQNKGLADNALAGVLKTSPYFVKDYKTAGKNYTEAQLEHIFYTLEEFDLRAKGVNNSGVERGELVREMVARILN